GAEHFRLLFSRASRSARAGRPRVRLREWRELPVPARSVPLTEPTADVNHRLAAGSAVMGAAVLTKMVDASIWFRDVMLPREARRLAKAAEAGRLDSRTRLESLREASAHLQYAARAW